MVRRRDNEADLNLAVEKLISLSEAMLDAARMGEWQQLVELEARRRPLLTAFFSVRDNTPSYLFDVDAVRTFIETVQAIDSKVLALAESGKTEAAQRLGILKNAHHGTSAYIENSPS